MEMKTFEYFTSWPVHRNCENCKKMEMPNLTRLHVFAWTPTYVHTQSGTFTHILTETCTYVHVHTLRNYRKFIKMEGTALTV